MNRRPLKSSWQRERAATAPLMDHASAEEEAYEAGVFAGAIGLIASEGPSSNHPVSEERLIVSRALEGHSNEARALANQSDAVVWLAEACAPPEPAPPRKVSSLHERILRSVSSTRPAAEIRPPALPPSLGPSEAIGRMHATLPEETRRAQLLEKLGGRGGAGHEATDRALYLLIDQYAPFLGFEVVFVSAVVGDSTVHRVHRGFPPELGDIDVVPRQLSFCTHTVSAREPFLVEDSASEPFFRQSDLVQKFGARAYLGIPLFANDGVNGDVVLGALCGVSATPRAIMPEDVELARRFARIAQALVTHDAAEVARLIAEPLRYPGAAPQPATSVLLTAEAFDEIVAAQRRRVAVRPQPTWLLDVSSPDWDKLPPTMLAGAVGPASAGDAGAARRRVLVPESHPELERVAGMLEGAERLG